MKILPTTGHNPVSVIGRGN